MFGPLNFRNVRRFKKTCGTHVTLIKKSSPWNRNAPADRTEERGQGKGMQTYYLRQVLFAVRAGNLNLAKHKQCLDPIPWEGGFCPPPVTFTFVNLLRPNLAQ